MKDNIFREYDIRGIVGKDLCIEDAYNLGRAIITHIKTKDPSCSRIIIGRDGRIHSQEFSQSVIASMRDTGIDVIDIGLVPTPVLYFAIHHLNNAHGLIITASHNPQEYNGIKLWGIWGNELQTIKTIFKTQTFIPLAPAKGTISSFDMLTPYITFLADQFKHLENASINAVIDCGNGTAGTVIPHLVKILNLQNVKLLFDEVDGTFPYHEADPTIPENMRYVKDCLVNNLSYKFGIGFDGDADRMNPMTKEGSLVPGDQLLSLFAKNIASTNPKQAVIVDIKSSNGLREVLEKWDMKCIISPSGHTYIKEAIKKHNAVLGGELSCHFFFKDRYFGYDDGIYAAFRLFEIMTQTQECLTTLLSYFPQKINSPEIRLSCDSDLHKIKIINHIKTVFGARKDVTNILIDGIKTELANGWGLARASNTQPAICLRFESSSLDGLNRVKQEFYDILIHHFDAQVLKESLVL